MQPYAITVTSEKYFPNVSIEKGEANLIMPEGLIHDLSKHTPHGTASIGTKKHHVNIKLNKVMDKIYFKQSLGGPTLVLNDTDNYLKAHAKINTSFHNAFDLKHNRDIPKLESI